MDICNFAKAFVKILENQAFVKIKFHEGITLHRTVSKTISFPQGLLQRLQSIAKSFQSHNKRFTNCIFEPS